MLEMTICTFYPETIQVSSPAEKNKANTCNHQSDPTGLPWPHFSSLNTTYKFWEKVARPLKMRQETPMSTEVGNGTELKSWPLCGERQLHT
jgi:hypothetical protein